MEEALKSLSKNTKSISNIIAIVTPIAIVVGAAFWYYENVWRPTVKVTHADYKEGLAQVEINGKTKTLYAGSSLSAGGGWAVKFASSNPYTDEEMTRIELVKNDLTYKTLDTNE